jgi:malate permease and related proteins
MAIVIILIKRLITMFVFMIIGAILYKRKYISEEGSKSLANLLIRLVLPCVIINGFLVERTPEKIKVLVISVIYSLLLLLLSIIIARLLFKKDPIAHFGTAFSNAGFFGIPVIISVLNDDAVFYIVPFIACLNILQWTYGVLTLKGEKTKINIKNIFISPFMVGFMIGMIIFLSGIKIPDMPKDMIGSFVGLNTPIAMLVSGVYLAKVDIKAMIRSPRLYKVAFARLLLIPMISMLLLSVLAREYYDLALCLFLASACPVGTNVAVYAQLHNKDYVYAVETVVMSTLLSIFSIPIFMPIIQMIWH